MSPAPSLLTLLLSLLAPHQTLSTSVCGVTYIKPDNVDNDTRIVGGYEAVPGSWPWQAYLVYQGDFVCGGTLISDQWVLSAGHCFFGGEDPKDWTIVLGEFDDSVV